MHRRRLLAALVSAPVVLGGWRYAHAGPRAAGAATPFDGESVPSLARALAARPYAPPDRALPPALGALGYDEYRDIRHRAARALWADAGLPFQAQFFHRGFLFQDRVALHEVADGVARPLAFATDLFDYGAQAVPDLDDVGFAGFRLHVPSERRADGDELCSFLGASYFRAVAQGLRYGISARGLALGTGEAEPEEFPLFRAFWLERPAAGAEAIVVHALLDSPGVAGAYAFRIMPRGPRTLMDVDARLYPRKALERVGIAPLTSMFAYDGSDRAGVDDYRPAVHDSDGLAMANGAGERLWRALANPPSLQHSLFQDRDPRGFGLLQRKRRFDDFLDLEADYELRPSLWVEPQGDWGEGAVHLVEIPTADEYHDNIVAAWRPAAPLPAGRESRWRYRLHWVAEHGGDPALGTVAATRAGESAEDGWRLFVLDWQGGALATLAADAAPQAEVRASTGEVRNAVAQHNRQSGGWRISFELRPQEARTAIELRARLLDGDRPLTETWLYRWTA